MAERSPFPDEEGVKLEEDESKAKEVILAALLLLTSRSPSTIRKAYANNTLPDLLTNMINQYKVDMDSLIPILISTANYGSRLVADRLSTYQGDDVIIQSDDIDAVLGEHIEFIINSTNNSIKQAQVEDESVAMIVLPFLIGLNANQSKKLINYYKAAKDKQAIEQIEKTLSSMRDEALSYRAEMIAASVVEDVLEEGKLIAARTIQLSTTNAIMKTWNCSFINSCQVCIGLHGERVPVGTPFSTGLYRPKAHSHCHCALTIEEVIQ